MSLMKKWRKLCYKLCPPKIPFCRENPWLSNHDIGEWSYGWPKVLSWGEDSTLKIGRFCSIGGNVTILLGGEHRTDWVSSYPLSRMLGGEKIYESNIRTKGDVVIGNDVWIGDGAIILSGVTIGDGAVIGARAVIVADVPPYAVAVGNPAVVIKHRFPPEQIEAFLRIQWWNWSLSKIKASLSLMTQDDIGRFIDENDGEEKGGYEQGIEDSI